MLRVALMRTRIGMLVAALTLLGAGVAQAQD